VTCK